MIQKFESGNELSEKIWSDTQTNNLILVAAPFVFITTNFDGKIRTVNPAIRSIFGYFEGEVEGEDLSMLIPELKEIKYQYFTHVSTRGELEMFNTENDFIEEEELVPEAKKISDYNYLERFIYGHLADEKQGEIQTQKKDGSAIWVNVSMNKIYVRGEKMFAVIISDITKRVQKENEVRLLNEQLEQRVIERTRQLEQSNQELTRALCELRETQKDLVESKKMAALGNLVAGIAHEINTPIGVGVTAASYLKDETDHLEVLYSNNTMRKVDFEDFLNVGKETSGMILSNLIRAGELIKSFKMIAVDQTAEHKRAFKLKKYLQDVIVSLQPKLKKTKHEITIKCRKELILDSYPGAFSQIITNLILNSLIHAFEPDDTGHIRIDVNEFDDHIKLIYSDDGKGLSKENVERIFEPFFTTKRNKGGTGLGMNIIYNIIEHQLKGRVLCESEEGKGIRFIITLPHL